MGEVSGPSLGDGYPRLLRQGGEAVMVELATQWRGADEEGDNGIRNK